jgi:hypothetical protein
MCKTCFHLHFTKFYNIVNYTPDLSPQYFTLRLHASPVRSHVILVVEVTALEVSITLGLTVISPQLYYTLLGYTCVYMQTCLLQWSCDSMITGVPCMWCSNPPSQAEECSTVVRSSFEVQTSKYAHVVRNTVVVEQCSQIKHPTGTASGQHVIVSQCCCRADSADVAVCQCCFEADRAEHWY